MSSRRWFRVRNEQVFSDLGAQSAGGHADMTAGGSLGPYTGPPADEPSDNHQADNHQADHELMAAIARGDRNAFALLVSRHLGRALVIARGFDGLEAEAEDVVQEAFTKVWTNAAQWQPPTDGSVEDRQRTGKASFATWFHRVLVNRCIDRQRQVKRGGRGRDAALDSIAEPA
ncbi:MAG: sigma factor, partial [Pseudomonadota bacterium]